VKTTAPRTSGGPSGAEPPQRSGISLAGTLALVLLAIGGLNWALVGLFDTDLIARVFGARSVFARVIYVAVGIAAVYCIVRLPRWSRAG
jgi:hypothetical protein